MAKFYYNDVLLPEIPQEVLSQYPYCWIRNQSELIVSASQWYYSSGSMYLSVIGTNTKYTISSTGDEWIFSKSWNDSGGYGVNQMPIWSSHDIPNGSATATDIYFYGSEPESPKVVKYLVKNQDVFYTIINNVLTPLEITELTADVFQTHGVDEVPEWSVISALVNPEILYWQDVTNDLPSITATMTATPFPQTVVSPNYDMLHDTILGVECAYVIASSDVVFAISVDDGVAWYMWTGQAWGTLTDTTTGMTAETINAITTEQWAGLMTTGQFKVRMTLFDENSSFTSFVIDYIN